MTFSSETICALSGADLRNLKRWYRCGFINKRAADKEWSEKQLEEVLRMTHLTSQGATLREIKMALDAAHPIRTGGWAARRGDVLWQLEYGSDRSLTVLLRKLASNFTSDDLVFKLLHPLNQWLRDDTRTGAGGRTERFHHLVVAHADTMITNARRTSGVPLLLESVSERNKTEIWLEAIRLSGQGFCVEILPFSSMDEPVAGSHEHHLFWCGAGLTEPMHQHYLTRLNKGHHVLLCGPDRRVHHLNPQLNGAVRAPVVPNLCFITPSLSQPGRNDYTY